jgi:hypothetical protein
MRTEQRIILEAADLLIVANNKFIEYYDIAARTPFKPQALHPAEECAIAYMIARIHLRRIAEDLGLNINSQLRAFRFCKTTEMSTGTSFNP